MTFVQVATTAQVPLGKSKLVGVAGRPIALHNVDGNIYATEELCPHRAGPLSEGGLTGPVITCPWHGARFDVTTGAVLQEPAQRPITCFPVKIEGDRILISVE